MLDLDLLGKEGDEGWIYWVVLALCPDVGG